MPIHFHDVDLTAEISGLKSALIVPCIMCPAVTVSIREQKPFMRCLRNPFKSAPFEQYLEALQSQLREHGVVSDVFNSRLYQNWFLCMWSAGRRRKLQARAKNYEAVILLGCDSATETIQEAVKSSGCKVIEAMKVGGLTNAKLKFNFPDKVSFDGVKIIPMSR